MTSTSYAAQQTHTGAAVPCKGHFLFKTIAIYLNVNEVGAARALLMKNGFADDQISLLGREQDNWEDTLKHATASFDTEHDAVDGAKTAIGTLEGIALGSIPGLVLVTGVVLSGGVGILVAGPMAAAMASLGLGALAGGVMGAVASNVDVTLDSDHVKKLVDAIGKGQWVIVAHSYDHAEAMLAQELLHNSNTVLESEVAEVI